MQTLKDLFKEETKEVKKDVISEGSAKSGWSSRRPSQISIDDQNLLAQLDTDMQDNLAKMKIECKFTHLTAKMRGQIDDASYAPSTSPQQV